MAPDDVRWPGAVGWLVHMLLLADAPFTADCQPLKPAVAIGGRRQRTSSRPEMFIGRQLLDAASTRAGSQPALAVAAPNISVVSSAAQFQAAVATGAQDIMLNDHIDLTDLGLAYGRSPDTRATLTVLGYLRASTRSIQGNCTAAPPPIGNLKLTGPDFLWEVPQCVIISDSDVFMLDTAVWLNHLLLRARPSRWTGFHFLRLWGDARLYATHVTLQGDGMWNTTAFSADNPTDASTGGAIFHNCTFDSIVGNDVGPKFYVDGASLTLNQSRLSNIRQQSAPVEWKPALNPPRFLFNGLFSLWGGKDTKASTVVANTTFTNVTANHTFWENGPSMVVTDGLTGVEDIVFSDPDQSDRAPAPEATLQRWPEDIPAPVRLSDLWITTVRQVLAAPLPSQISAAEDPPPHPPPPPPAAVPGDAPPEVAAVYTAEQLQEAFHAGVRDIEIHDHMDLRDLPPVDKPITGRLPGALALGFVGHTTRSIRGVCTSAPPRDLTPAGMGLNVSDPEPWRSPRCVLVADAGFWVDRPGLWLDSLHLQYAPRGDGPLAAAVLVEGWGSLFMTHSVVQGAPGAHALAVQIWQSSRGAYVQDCVFNHLIGRVDFSGALQFVYGPASFKSCTFKTLSEAPSQPWDLWANGWSTTEAALLVVGRNATAAFENCTFQNILSTWPAIVRHGATLFSDDRAFTTIDDWAWEMEEPEPLVSLKRQPPQAPVLLQETDPWFVAAQQALTSIPASAYLPDFPLKQTQVPQQPQPPPLSPPPPPLPSPPPPSLPPPPDCDDGECDGDTSGSSGTSSAVAAGVGMAAGAVVLFLLGLGIMCWMKRRRRRPLAKASDTGMMRQGEANFSADIKVGGMQAHSWPHAWSSPGGLGLPMPPINSLAVNGKLQQGSLPTLPSAGGSHVHGSAGSGGATDTTHTVHTESEPYTCVSVADWPVFERAAAGARAQGPVAELEVALDAMHAMQTRWHGRYQLLSSSHRYSGGQAVVQLAVLAPEMGGSGQVAIKFYLDRAVFERERQLYCHPQLRPVMPATMAVDDNARGTSCTPYGYVFPPFLVIESGESLDMWMQREHADQDFVTILQILSHTVRALATLHRAGYAHRDIKPGNILRRPQQHDWTLIDFGCTEPAGSVAACMLSLRYAAPETVEAVESGCSTVTVTTAVDVWAVGVIAYELLTGEPVFPGQSWPCEQANAEIRAALAGRAALPWEEQGAVAKARLQKLRGLRRSVLQCLHRNPAERPQAAVLLRAWDHAFDQTQSRGTTWTAT